MKLQFSEIVANNNLLDQLSVGVFVKSCDDFTYLYANQYCLQHATKLKKKDFIGRTDYELPWDMYADSYLKNDYAIIKNDSMSNMLFMLTNSCSEKVIAHNLKFPCYDDAGSILGIVGIFNIVEGKFHEMSNYMSNLNQQNLQICSYLQNSPKCYDPYLKLTPRESLCLFYTLQGMSAKDAAKHINISDKTLASHLANIRLKWNCHNKQDLLSTADKLGCFNVMPTELFLANQ